MREDTTTFHPVPELRGEAVRLDDDAFSSVHPVPALLFLASGEGSGGPAKEESLFLIHTTPGKSGLAGFYHNKVAFLTKRPGNPFAQMITVGRAANNDIAVEVPTISKFHCFFERHEGGWRFAAQVSVNGTSVNGAKVAPGERRVVKDGDRIQLGEDLEALFLGPVSLRRRILEMKAPP